LGDAGVAVAVDSSGNVVATGSSQNDFYTAKYAAADGALLWEHRYSGPANFYEGAIAVVVDSSGDAVVTGHSSETTSSTDFYTAKYAAANGTLLWEKRYNGPGSWNDFASAVAVDGSSSLLKNPGIFPE